MSQRKEARRLLWSRQRGRCALCGDEMTMATNGIDRDYDVDHILPKSLGGTFAMSNLQLTHKRCNRAKGNLMPL